jgi:hypothetical protein
MAALALTTPMRRALTMAYRNGGALVRREGGFWTWPDCPKGEWLAPTDYVDTPAVYGLQRLGLLAPSADHALRSELTDAGREAARAAEAVAA